MIASNANPGDEYLRTKVLTASPEQLQLMMYDAAIRFARQGRDALAAGTLDVSCNKLLRAQRIVLELNGGLRPQVDPELCDRLRALYHFIYRRLVDASIRREVRSADEAIALLEHQRQTWLMLMQTLAATAAQAAPSPVPATHAAAFAPAPSLQVSLNIAG
jgi:flagellar protein FliS